MPSLSNGFELADMMRLIAYFGQESPFVTGLVWVDVGLMENISQCSQDLKYLE